MILNYKSCNELQLFRFFPHGIPGSLTRNLQGQTTRWLLETSRFHPHVPGRNSCCTCCLGQWRASCPIWPDRVITEPEDREALDALTFPENRPTAASCCKAIAVLYDSVSSSYSVPQAPSAPAFDSGASHQVFWSAFSSATLIEHRLSECHTHVPLQRFQSNFTLQHKETAINDY